MEMPDSFLISRLSDENQNPAFKCVCPGFELKKWRFERLAAHLTDWLPDFAIRHDDLPDEIRGITEYRKLIEQAALRVYNTEKTESRGEIGELLLHAVCRQFSGTFPTVSKVYYKTSSNDVVKGFDLVHTRYDEVSDELQLWLGEAKFYTSGNAAVREAIASITSHLEAGFLNAEKMLLGGKVSSDTPGYSKLEWLFERDTPLDEIFERLVIPILIAYDSDIPTKYLDEASYDLALSEEIGSFQEKFASKLPNELSIYCIYFPMDSKKSLIDAFDKKLGAYL